ncbi:urea amidolyase family protein [Cellulomonas iranensis]|uniref:5-oxoprolinase subunit B/C family protein n=1 Tax=Cellulomonas iranensis TaxID=76862 RepID=UPI000B3BF96C|nr:urea amidolyase family protein [Cellulomonas iranensis]
MTTVQPYGDDAVLVEVADLAAVHALDARLRADPPRGVVDVVPAARTVLVRGEPRSRARWAAEVAALAHDAQDAGPGRAPARTVEVPTVYDGADLDDVARTLGLTVDDVVARHLAGGPGGYRVAFGGFMPGFAYVTGLDPVLHVPRLARPRTRVPAGSVAVAGDLTAVYPAPTPGGWRLLGRTDLALFDASRGAADAALLRAGDRVRFVRTAPAALTGAPRPPAGAPAAADPPAASPSAPATAAATGRPACDPDRDDDPVRDVPPLPLALTVVAAGPLTLVQDAGRPGLAAVGVPRSGAADPAALARANRLVGNARDAAVLETVLGGLVVRFGAATAFALVGAVDDADLDGAPVPVGVAVRAPGGATLTLHAPARGLRSWLAVRGGVDVPGVLGSRSRDVLSGLGPAPLRAGDVLAYGTAYDGLPEPPGSPDLPVPPGPPGGAAHARDAVHPAPPAVVHLPAVEGPRLTHLDAAGRVRLWSTVWEVSPDSNRVAGRLTGPALTRAATGELPSEGLVAGAVQVPHDGRPVLFGPDHPVTGGYPVVAVLTPDGRARAAQLRPGDRVRLVRALGGASA